jgi:hypothetical protein
MTPTRFILLMILLISVLLTNIVLAESLLLNKKVLSQHKVYTPIDLAMRAKLEDEFFKLFQNKESLITDFYDLTTYTSPTKTVKSFNHEVHGLSKKYLGWGQFAFATREVSSSKFFVQVTHRFNDRHTLNIANHLWKNRRVDKVYTNVVHRYAGKKQALKSNSDFSTASPSALLAVTRAWLAYRPDGVIVQLHGFSQGKRHSAVAKTANMIISHGIHTSNEENPILVGLKQCLKNTLKLKVAIYPTEVNELGGTQNVIAKEVRVHSDYRQFLHIEIDGDTRKRLRNNIKDSFLMFDCVEKIYL